MSLLDLLPEITAGLGVFGAFEGITQFLKRKRVQKYLGLTSEVLEIFDTILNEHPEYNGSKAEDIIDTAIYVTVDGKISWRDFKSVKNLIIELYDPRKSSPRRLVGRKEAKKKKVEELISNED